MARASHAQSESLNDAKSSSSNKLRWTREITALLLFILVPLALSLYWSAFRPYLPSHYQAYLPANQEENISASVEELPSPEQLLKACEKHQYTSEIISLDPLVIYINNFTSSQEAEELINIGSPDFTESFISRSRGANTRVTGRTSQSAPLSMDNPLVSCILGRARKFMGSMLLPHEPFSTPQLVRYFPSQKYDLHTDFWPEHQIMNDGSNRLFNRVASFFVFLRDDCTEGYTYFPLVEPSHNTPDAPHDLQALYGEKVKRGEVDGEKKGLKFKPIQGNAVFWVNVKEDGSGDGRVVHAGLPVGEGEKIGLNIWPRKFYGAVNDGSREGEKVKRKWSGKWKE